MGQIDLTYPVAFLFNHYYHALVLLIQDKFRNQIIFILSLVFILDPQLNTTIHIQIHF